MCVCVTVIRMGNSNMARLCQGTCHYQDNCCENFLVTFLLFITSFRMVSTDILDITINKSWQTQHLYDTNNQTNAWPSPIYLLCCFIAFNSYTHGKKKYQDSFPSPLVETFSKCCEFSWYNGRRGTFHYKADMWGAICFQVIHDCYFQGSLQIHSRAFDHQCWGIRKGMHHKRCQDEHV